MKKWCYSHSETQNCSNQSVLHLVLLKQSRGHILVTTFMQTVLHVLKWLPESGLYGNQDAFDLQII